MVIIELRLTICLPGILPIDSMTGWLDLRNKAAHGKYDEYNKNKVEQMIMGVRDFIVRNPA
ncbi:hypothetical protein LCGC14_0657070 [marine sediment metagenome]|uniref:DUF4145 domain-containing protein n=1 Tax=marine sediment metagenome TaxID=412755 RepID=A0A0F9TGB7_9ZZZZ